MKKLFFIANWKSHKNSKEAIEWLREFQISNIQYQISSNAEIILCPPFPLLPLSYEFIQKHHLSISLGSQTISSYQEGAYTGEVSGRLLKDFVKYSLIGHSERRRLFGETIGDVQDKVKMALTNNIKPIVLVSNYKDIPKGVDIIIYEPPGAISSEKGFNPEDPDDVETAANEIKKKKRISFILYGGSVTPENIRQYTSIESINGVIIGNKSLDPKEFSAIIQEA